MTDMQYQKHMLPAIESHEQALRRRKTVRAVGRAALLLLLLMLCGLGRTLYLHWSNGKVLAARAADNAVMHVRVTHAAIGDADANLTLPGTVLAVREAQIQARASGYVVALRKDIGEAVQQGELLAQIDMPEVKRQVDEADANFQLAKSAYERGVRLHAEDALSVQELDEKKRAYRQTEAVLQRAREQLGFGRVVAPFAGIVTRRSVNVGELVTSGAGPGLFTIAGTGQLHAYLYLPEQRARQVRVGDQVKLVQPDRAGQLVQARVVRTAGAIDLGTHTLQIDVAIPHADHGLLPGSYVEASLHVTSSGNVVLPTNTLLFSAAGPQVAVVKDGKVVRRNVTLGTDYGRTVEIRAGVDQADAVIVNPPDAIIHGQAVLIEASTVKRGA